MPVGFAAPPPPPPPRANADDVAAREEIVRLLVARGAFTELDEAKRPAVVSHRSRNGGVDEINGWERGSGPVFSAAQAAPIVRALAAK